MSNRIRKLKLETLSDHWYTLQKASYEYLRDDGQWETQVREAYDRGNGAVILLYQRTGRKVVLTKQFRLPTYLNGNPDGHLIEAAAGLLDSDQPEECVIREAEEETGYRVSKVTKVFEAYMSPGSVTEVLHFYIAPYDESMRVSMGGGLDEETENIEVLEMDFDLALEWVASGRIKDAKTIMLLQYLRIHIFPILV